MNTNYLELKTGNHYYIVICFQGALAFDYTLAYKNYAGQVPTQERVFKLITDFWNNIDEDWKKDYQQGKSSYVGGGYMTG